MTKHSIESKQNRPASTELQKISQKENYALFTLAGMKGQLAHLRNVVPTKYISSLIESIECAEVHIKLQQRTRK